MESWPETTAEPTTSSACDLIFRGLDESKVDYGRGVGHTNSSEPSVGTVSWCAEPVGVIYSSRADHAATVAGFAEYPRNSPPSRLLHHTVSAGSTGSDRAIGVFMLSARCGRSWL